MQRGPLQALGGHAQVDLARLKLGGHDRGGRLVQLEAHLRVFGEEAGGEVGDGAQRLGGDGHHALGEAGGVVELVLALVELADGARDPGEEHGAEAVELDPPSVTVEERDPELGFEARDRPAEGRLGDVQLGRRPAHVLVVGDGLEVAQLQEIHHPPPYAA